MEVTHLDCIFLFDLLFCLYLSWKGGEAVINFTLGTSNSKNSSLGNVLPSYPFPSSRA